MFNVNDASFTPPHLLASSTVGGSTAKRSLNWTPKVLKATRLAHAKCCSSATLDVAGEERETACCRRHCSPTAVVQHSTIFTHYMFTCLPPSNVQPKFQTVPSNPSFGLSRVRVRCCVRRNLLGVSVQRIQVMPTSSICGKSCQQSRGWGTHGMKFRVLVETKSAFFSDRGRRHYVVKIPPSLPSSLVRSKQVDR